MDLIKFQTFWSNRQLREYKAKPQTGRKYIQNTYLKKVCVMQKFQAWNLLLAFGYPGKKKNTRRTRGVGHAIYYSQGRGTWWQLVWHIVTTAAKSKQSFVHTSRGRVNLIGRAATFSRRLEQDGLLNYRSRKHLWEQALPRTLCLLPSLWLLAK